MLRNIFTTSLPRLYRYPGAARASASSKAPCLIIPWRPATLVATTAAVLLWYCSSDLIHNDSEHVLPPNLNSLPSQRINSTGVDEDGVLCTVVWGSNKSNLIDPQSPGIEIFQIPVNVRWLENTALRDMALHERHAACVDARGDVFQWGDGFFGSKSGPKAPKATLRGKNIVKVQLTDTRVYALSASGKIYIFAANQEQQKPLKPQTASTTLWWISSWIGREKSDIDFAEIFPKEKLQWGETFISIAAGSNHLLALTSKGRTFSHPTNKAGNSHGQLGLRKVEIPVPSSSLDGANRSHISVELVPQSIADPYAKMPLLTRETSTVASEHPAGVIEDNHIKFSDALFEIPSLRGVKVSRIAAGSRSSFVNTTSGRVLGWGANDHGQIGLGSGITLDTITIPTEIDLTRNIPFSTKSRCLDIVASGDLTCFVAERNTRDSLTYVDILSCGNGQWGGLGNKSFSTFQGNPVLVKNISGLQEFNEEEQILSPVIPHAISVSPTGHVLLTLDTQLHAGPGGSGRDLVAWGLNHDYQLGTGKRTSLNAPTTLERPEGGRFILSRRKTMVRGLSGNAWNKNVEVEQCAVSGHGNSIIYWKIKSPKA